MIQTDITIIGGGPGGYGAALLAARLKARVTLIEKNKLGGTCLNEGCIPTKALLKCAEVFALSKKAAQYGVEGNQPVINYPKALQFKEQVVRRLQGGVVYLVKNAGVNLIEGEGRIVEPGRVEVQTAQGRETVESSQVIIASGSAEVEIPGFAFDGTHILNSSQMLACRELPKKLAIIGGGVIGCEFASIFSRLGVEVTIIELTPRLIPAEDEELALALQQALTQGGVKVLTGTRALAADVRGAGEIVLKIEPAGGPAGELVCSQVLVCVGRKAALERAGIGALGLTVERGTIVTDGHMQTSIPGIYAVGDVTAGEQLAHVAYHEARVAVLNLLGRPETMDYTAVPHCIYTAPEVASVGQSEAGARQTVGNIQVHKMPFNGNGKALIEGQADGFIKVVSQAGSGRILGAGLIGPKATELLAEFTLAVRQGATLTDLARTIHPHPTLSEASGELGLAAAGWALHAIH